MSTWIDTSTFTGVITRVAVVPYPPLLVPDLTVRAGAETEYLRNSCLRAVSSLTEIAAEWVAVGADRSGPAELAPETTGTFAGFGVDLRVALGTEQTEPADPMLPLPALVAGWLRGQVGARAVDMRLLDPDTSADECADIARELDEQDRPLLVLADGTNCRDERSPRPLDSRAAALDASIRDALAAADPDPLLAMDPALAADLGVQGRAGLQVLAHLARQSGVPWRGDLLYSATPFGVSYHVAVWTRYR